MGRVPDSDQVRALLLAREARGLRVPTLARMLLPTFGLAVVGAELVLAPAPTAFSGLVALVFGTLTVALGLNMYLYWLLSGSRYVERVGLAGAVFDGLFVVVLSLLAQRAGAEDGLAAGYVFKTELPITVLTIVVINGLALRPRYPLIVGGGAVLALLLPVYEVMVDPGTRVSVDRMEVYAGTAVDVGHLVTSIAMVVGASMAVVFAAHAARQTIRRGIQQELDNASLQQEQLRVVMREKVRALGKLVAGLSHEINTPMGALRSSVDTQQRVLDRLAQSLKQATEAGDASDQAASMERVLGIGGQSLTTMRAAAERISGLEASLRALSHLDEADLRKVDLGRELQTVLTAARRQLNPDTTVVLELAPVPEIYLNAAEINQALLTIITNAFEAAGPTGTVTLRLSADGPQVRLEIADDGPGLPPARVAELFDVSLGGKGERVGAGLGLATAQSTVHRHGGDLTCQSRLGAGATFHLRLPLDTPGGTAT